MTRILTSAVTLAAILALPMALAACSGGGDGMMTTTTTTAPPGSPLNVQPCLDQFQQPPCSTASRFARLHIRCAVPDDGEVGP